MLNMHQIIKNMCSYLCFKEPCDDDLPFVMDHLSINIAFKCINNTTMALAFLSLFQLGLLQQYRPLSPVQNGIAHILGLNWRSFLFFSKLQMIMLLNLLIWKTCEGIFCVHNEKSRCSHCFGNGYITIASIDHCRLLARKKTTPEPVQFSCEIR